MTITHKHVDEIFEYDGSQINPSWAFQEFGIYGSSIITWIGPVNITPDNLKDFEILTEYGIRTEREGDDIFVDGGKLSISIASISLSSSKIHFALNLEDKGTPDDVKTIGLYDIKINNQQVFDENNLLELITKTVNRFIDELETIENDISKTKVLG